MTYQQNRKAALKRLKSLIYSPKSNIETFRNKIEEEYACPVLPNYVDCTEHNYGGIACDVISPEIYSSRRIIIYIHGGSFIGGSRTSYRGFCARLATKAYSRIVLPEFRLAPYHPYPAALEDVQSVFRAVYTEIKVSCSMDSKGNSSIPEIIIAADSSGASIATALIFNLRERYRYSISKIIFISPWLDFTEEIISAKGKKLSDELIDSDTIVKCGEMYTYASNLENPLVSPIMALPEQFANFPPVYIQCGEKEILLYAIKRFESLIKENGGECEVDIWENMMSLFTFADDYLWETRIAIEKLGKMVCGDEELNVGVSVENKPRLENSVKSNI